MPRQDPSGGDRKRPDPPSFRAISIVILFGLLFLVSLAMFGTDGFSVGTEPLTYTELIDAIDKGRVKSLRVQADSWHVTGSFRQTAQAVGQPERFSSQLSSETHADVVEAARTRGVEVKLVPPSFLVQALGWILPMVLITLFFYFFVFRQLRGGGGGGILSFGKSRAVRITRDKNRKTFEDVAGIDEAREEVREIIEFLRNPEKFQRLGGRLPRGVLLIGAPGTGKTLLAKAIAGEADVPFFSISGSEFVEMFVGVGASRVRDLFEQAKNNSPCIVFLDEIDAVGRKRVNELPGGGAESAQTLNAMLVEMDGIGSDDNVIVLAATNRPDVLDPALLRPGRFDRRIVVDLPDIKGRAAILDVHCKTVKISPDVDLSVVARGTPTFSGADLANIVNEAALIAAMRGREAVDMECFEEARDKVRWGKAKHSRQMSEEDKRATAFHEAGHALLMRLLPHVSPLHKVSIIPRGMALGATMQLPEKDEYSMGKRRILGEITVRFGGRVAEELFLDDITSGAANDFEQATNLVRSMVCEWGMSDELGPVKYSDRNGSGGYETNFFEGREFSEATAEKIDEEVRRIVDLCYSEALELLKRHEEDVRLLVDALMEYETLGREEVDLLLNERKLEAVADYRRGLREAREARLAKEGAGVMADERTLEHEGRDVHPPLPSEDRDAPPR